MRSTHIIDIIEKITPSIGKRIDTWSTAQGMIALFRYEDGQAYEVEIRPASLSKFEPFDKFTKKNKPVKESAMHASEPTCPLCGSTRVKIPEDLLPSDYAEKCAHCKDCGGWSYPEAFFPPDSNEGDREWESLDELDTPRGSGYSDE